MDVWGRNAPLPQTWETSRPLDDLPGSSTRRRREAPFPDAPNSLAVLSSKASASKQEVRVDARAESTPAADVGDVQALGDGRSGPGSSTRRRRRPFFS